VDLSKYRAIFIEEATEHLSEMSAALLRLEKDPACAEDINCVMRMAHSIKGMAGTLDYDPITDVAHRLEDLMLAVGAAGRFADGSQVALLFRGMEALESMVAAVRSNGEVPAADPALVEALAESDPAKKKSPAHEADPVNTTQAVPTAPSVPPLDAPAPPPSIRVQTETLDRFLSTVGEVVLNSSQLRTAAESDEPSSTGDLSAGLDRMDRVVGELQRRALELRTTPLLRIVEPLPRVAREVAEMSGRRVEVEISGAELDLDRSILDRLSDPLVHLVRNAVDHGIEPPDARVAAGKRESGRVSIDAQRVKDQVRIAVSDDGRGIDLEAVRAGAVERGLVVPDLAEDLTPQDVAAFVFHPGLSTAERISHISGRGVGMDAVRATIESLGGTVELVSEPGQGTTLTLVVPVSAAVQRVLVVTADEERFAIPVRRVERILEIPRSEIESSGGESFALIDDEPVPVVGLAERACLTAENGDGACTVLILEVRDERMGLVVGRVVGQQQIYVKPLPTLLTGLRTLAGLTILGDGRPVFLLDVNQLV
jgi:two-component system chemotaxis sensor kinase CheA